MSEYQYSTEFKGRDLDIIYEFEGGADTKHGDFDMYVTIVYDNGVNIFDDISDEDLDAMADMICDNEDLTGMAFEQACDNAELLRDQREDR
jgi:hypothetical protein